MNSKDSLWIRSMEICSKYFSCHQMPERSFFIRGYQFPLCARCTGIALGYVTALFIAPFHLFCYPIGVLMIPLMIDGTVQYFTSYKSNNYKRVVTGFLYGFAFTSITIRFINTVIKKLLYGQYYRKSE